MGWDVVHTMHPTHEGLPTIEFGTQLYGYSNIGVDQVNDAIEHMEVCYYEAFIATTAIALLLCCASSAGKVVRAN